MNATLGDIKSWNGLRSGNETDLRFFYVQYYKELLHYGMYLTHDISLSKEYINRLFTNLWSKRNALPEVASPKAYIMASYKNLVIFRKESKSSLMLTYPGDEKINEGNTWEYNYEEIKIELEELEQQQNKISKALDLLSGKQKELIISRFMEEKSYQEIANAYHITVRTVYNSIHESLKILRNKLNKEDFF